jgi:hypothetical protein
MATLTRNNKMNRQILIGVILSLSHSFSALLGSQLAHDCFTGILENKSDVKAIEYPKIATKNIFMV